MNKVAAVVVVCVWLLLAFVAVKIVLGVAHR